MYLFQHRSELASKQGALSRTERQLHHNTIVNRTTGSVSSPGLKWSLKTSPPKNWQKDMLCRPLEYPDGSLRESLSSRAFTGFGKICRLPLLVRTDKLSWLLSFSWAPPTDVPCLDTRCQCLPIIRRRSARLFFSFLQRSNRTQWDWECV